MAKDLKEAIVKMMKLYWKGEDPAATSKASPNRKYTKKYFDTVAKDNNLPMDNHADGENSAA